MAFLVILGAILAFFTIGPVLLMAAVAIWFVSPVLFILIAFGIVFGIFSVLA